MIYEFTFTDERSVRVDLAVYQWLSAAESAPVGISRAQVQQLIESGKVLVNGKPVSKNHLLVSGDVVSANTARASVSKPTVAVLPVITLEPEIIYEDEYLAVVNKPKGLVVHGAPGHTEATLVDILSVRMPLSDIGDPDRLGVVHRLDKNTSGAMLIAKDVGTHNLLAQQFEQHQIDKRYRALVFGTPRISSGLLDYPIDRHKTNRVRMAIDSAGRDARTIYTVQSSYGDFSALELQLLTGRTHQIRVHLEKLGHPVVGDDMYGRLENARWFDFVAGKDLRNAPKVWKERWDTAEAHAQLVDLLATLPGQFLHAHSLEFVHPQTQAKLRFEASFPAGWSDFVSMLSGARNG